MTPLYLAAKGKQTEDIRCLVEAGANIEHQCKCGLTLKCKLDLCGFDWNNFTYKVSDSSVHSTKYVESNVLFQCDDGTHPLYTAALKEDHKLFSFLCSSGADITTVDNIHSSSHPQISLMCMFFNFTIVKAKHATFENNKKAILTFIAMLNNGIDATSTMSEGKQPPKSELNALNTPLYNPVELLLVQSLKMLQFHQNNISIASVIEKLIVILMNAGTKLKLSFAISDGELERSPCMVISKDGQRRRLYDEDIGRSLPAYKNMVKRICEYLGNARPLASYCRIIIRQRLYQNRGKAEQLDVPLSLIDFLNLSDCVPEDDTRE